jgi:3-deoxy-7-phosphoheptulonate synthase
VRGACRGEIGIERDDDDATECDGGARGLSELDLAADESRINPQLDDEHALETALLVARTT